MTSFDFGGFGSNVFFVSYFSFVKIKNRSYLLLKIVHI